jgi:hypothetical protein
MVKIIKFVYVIIIFMSIFIIATNANGKSHYFAILKFNFIITFCLIFFPFLFLTFLYFSFYFIVVFNECGEDADCPQAMCFKTFVAKCINNNICACVYDGNDDDDDLP